MDNPHIQERLSQLTPEYRALINSPYTSETARIFGKELELEEKQIDILENGFILYLLFFLTKEEFAGFITTECGVLPKTSMKVVNAIHIGLPETVSKGLDEIELIISQAEDLESSKTDHRPADDKSVSVKKSTTTDSKVANPQPKKPEVDPSVFKPASVSKSEDILRTMKKDIDRIHGYGAYRNNDDGQSPAKNSSDTKAAPAPAAAESVYQASSQADVLHKTNASEVKKDSAELTDSTPTKSSNQPPSESKT